LGFESEITKVFSILDELKTIISNLDKGILSVEKQKTEDTAKDEDAIQKLTSVNNKIDPKVGGVIST
jgi:hypothetical protein